MSWITGVPPAEIIKIIREDPVLEQLSIQQIYNLKARYKQATLRNTKIDLMELVALCKAMENTPTDEDINAFDVQLIIMKIIYLLFKILLLKMLLIIIKLLLMLLLLMIMLLMIIMLMILFLMIMLLIIMMMMMMMMIKSLKSLLVVN